jgi:hypothetical protein
MSEDEIVVAFAAFGAQRGCNIMAAAANQASTFAFRAGPLRRKAPDIALYRDQVLYLFEAKILARHLFSRGKHALSDADCLISLLNTPTELASNLR